MAGKNSDPFMHWKSAVAFDHLKKFVESEDEFKKAAQFFFDSASKHGAVAKAMLEFSTLMDAFSKIASGRRFLSENNFSRASEVVPGSSEVLRSTLHFAFLAPYISACATLETLAGMKNWDEDKFQAYRTTNALLEQAKFALSFRDETHTLITVIEAFLKFSISGALHFEADSLLASGATELAADKESRSHQVRREYEHLARRAGLELDEIEFFPQRDFVERDHAPLLLAYPDSENLWLLNVGMHPARLQKLGDLIISKEIPSISSASFELRRLTKGKIRVEYLDPFNNERHNVGCMTLV
ncbi:MAG: hypothetical protein ACRECH_04150 [Nitrososphaerales archaeon]